jgi:hypothetical protein
VIQTKTETIRELAETITERGRTRPLLLRVANGHVYARLKGTRDGWTMISVEGAYRHAQTHEAALPTGSLSMTKRKAYKHSAEVSR